MLKADISKAFDKLDWGFLQDAMVYLNVPRKIIDIMLFSFKNAKVVIQVNGSGDGFIQPTRGIRQGCPMSPYCFIMVMEPLTRKLQQALASQQIRGVNLAPTCPTCPTLTHIIYADDLILLGQAELDEVQEMNNIMQEFGAVSGLVINPTKSKLWFSRRCAEQQIQTIKSYFQADEADSQERYLGTLISRSNTATKTAQLLLDKLKSKLTGWRSNMLSHAGRLVLIKSVLMSVPVYHMSVEVLPKGIIKKMESLIAKFFWGKSNQTKYLSFLAWKKICQPIENGGLGVRQLESFGDALFLKLVWSMISEDSKIWVQVCKGKYYNNLGFWRSTNVSGASPMWRQTVNKRDFFKQNIRWQIGDGEKVQVMSQPWYNNWQIVQQASRNDRKITVAQIFDAGTNEWRREEIARLLGDDVVAEIVQNVQKPGTVLGLEDKMIWDRNKSGCYTVKDGYPCVVASLGRGENEISWKYIWKWKNIQPKVKIFLWRLFTNALPLAQNLHQRIQAISPMCARCNQENEYSTHCFFFCQGSRLVWFGGDLGIRTDSLPLDIKEAIQFITTAKDEGFIKTFAYTLWEIWLARNDCLFQRKNFNPVGVCQKVRAWTTHPPDTQTVNARETSIEEMIPYELAEGGWQMIVDGSWDTSTRAGIAFLLYKDGVLHVMGLEGHNAANAFLAETMAMEAGVKQVGILMREHSNLQVQIYTDCLNLVSAIQENDVDNLPSWRARQTMAEIIRLIALSDNAVQVRYARREALRPVHDLANHARRTGAFYHGVPSALIMSQHNIGMNLDTRYFQQVQEAPP
ncbi:RNA-directed DNA polymerase (reverse transcriptase)-related family protein [Rhynchospora pubera]|uniref:RNA-directed DNA polymerase (Reverse transcriptase)-related family protein n=1 Tax=Rhynchospora pubera TaxID=906938 RepID=A0AAV8GFA0_9POAL|nr:RNA-directed DNA polymerase (reverse transcriptase)-related family protein [Rhynchospora pubera]